MAMGPVTWGLTVVTARRSSPSDISLDLMTQISPDSDVIRGRGLWRVGVFGSSSANGSSDERFNYVRQLLDPTQASLPVGPDTKLSFPVLPTQFDIMKLGCSKFKYICLEIAKGDDPQPDFVFHNDAQKPLIFCKSVACPGPPKPVVRLVSLDWGLRLLEHRIGNSSNVSVGVSIATSERSSPLNGTGLWKLGFFVSENGSPETDATRGQYLEQILGEAASSTPVTPGMPLDFLNVQTAFDLTGMGCNGSEFNYICISFAKGESPDPDFDLPLRNDEAVSCKRISCQEGAGSDGPVAQYIRMGAAADIPSEGTELSATVDITAASSSERIDGDGLWRVGVFGSRDSNGGGRRNGEVRNILDRNSLRRSLVPGRDMRLSGTFNFPNVADLGCTSDYRYLCFEFAKGDRPSVRFTMQSNVMCREQTSCNSGNTGGGGNPGGSGNVARYTNLGADISVRGTRVSADITVTPDSSTDQISGNGLWRVGAFGSTNAQGNGRKNGEVRNILDYFGQRKTLRRGSPMELSGSFNFPNAADLGCSNAYRYLCFEFDKGESPSMDFTMQSTIMCQERTCESGSRGGSGSTGGHGGRPTRPTGGSGSSGGSNDPKTVKIRGLAWALDGSSVEASVNLESNPSDFEGRFLWRMGAFASPSSTGEGRRYDETRQILANPDRSRSIRSGRPNTFTSSTGLDIRGLGCDEKRYLCLEFGQGPNPNPPFTIQNGDTREETKVACKIQQCNQEPQIRVNSVRPTAIEISEGQRNDVEFDVTVKYVTADTTSIRGSSLWKVQAWGAKTAGDVNPKVSVADQVLSSFQQDTMVEGSSGSSFNFQRVSHTFDMTGRKCPEMKFFCVRLQKDRPRPDFRLMARNDDPERLMGCMKVTCNAAAKPKFTATNIGIVRTPFSAARADRNNPVELDVQINYDRATTTSISGDPQWALEAWGSAKKNGKGRKISPSNLDLGYQGHQTFEEGGVLRFSSIPYNFDLTGQECQKSKFLCLRLTKTGAGFTLKGKPNSKALTKCAPYSCLPASGSPSGGGGGSGGAGGGGGGGGNSQPVDVTINSFTANFDEYPVSETEVPITMNVQMGITPNSGVPSGPNLWHIAVYGNSRSDGSDPDKRGYTGNLLTPKQAKTRITPGSVTNINDIRFDFNMNGIGCHPYNYLCIEYGKGSSQKLNMVYPRDGLGVSCTVQRCPN